MKTEFRPNEIIKHYENTGFHDVSERSRPYGPTTETNRHYHNSGNIVNSTGKIVGNYKK